MRPIASSIPAVSATWSRDDVQKKQFTNFHLLANLPSDRYEKPSKRRSLKLLVLPTHYFGTTGIKFHPHFWQAMRRVIINVMCATANPWTLYPAYTILFILEIPYGCFIKRNSGDCPLRTMARNGPTARGSSLRSDYGWCTTMKYLTVWPCVYTSADFCP